MPFPLYQLACCHFKSTGYERTSVMAALCTALNMFSEISVHHVHDQDSDLANFCQRHSSKKALRCDNSGLDRQAISISQILSASGHNTA